MPRRWYPRATWWIFDPLWFFFVLIVLSVGGVVAYWMISLLGNAQVTEICGPIILIFYVLVIVTCAAAYFGRGPRGWA